MNYTSVLVGLVTLIGGIFWLCDARYHFPGPVRVELLSLPTDEETTDTHTHTHTHTHTNGDGEGEGREKKSVLEGLYVRNGGEGEGVAAQTDTHTHTHTHVEPDTEGGVQMEEVKVLDE
jgi:hypothetical protein